MISQRTKPPIVIFSVKVYQTLLRAYPTKFQQEYGSEMAQVFRDCCLRAIRQGGTNGMIRLWVVTLLDFVQSVISEHTHKETDMSNSQLIRFSGWAFILGSFAFVTILTGSDAVTFPGSVISAILLAVGLSGLRARYGEQAGDLGRNILKAGVIGMILFCLVLALLGLAVLVLPGIRSQVESLAHAGLWLLMFGGPVVVLLGLTLYGLTALRNKPMPRLNGLPFFSGIWYPAFYFFLASYLFTHNGVYPTQYQTTFNLIFLTQFVALCVLGAILVSDTPQEMTAA
jgi:hypothetical protein